MEVNDGELCGPPPPPKKGQVAAPDQLLYMIKKSLFSIAKEDTNTSALISGRTA